ncbi:MAG: EamA family transporter [Candidatus Wenzhouxiangella sp. M2_3B_020]
MDKRFVRLLAWAAFSVGALGFAPLAKKAALVAGAAVWSVVLSTAVVSAVLVVSWVVARGRAARLVGMTARQHLSVLTVGTLGSGLVPLLAVLAMTETSASNRSLFQAAYPAATAIAARFMLGERLSASSYLLIVSICIGLALMNVQFGNALPSISPAFWMLLATLPMIGVADSIAKHSLHDLSPEVVAAGRAVGGAAVLLLAVPVVGAPAWSALGPVLHWILLAGLCMAGFAIGLYELFQRTRASLAASLIAMAPVVTLAAERALLDVSLTPLQWLGFMIVVASVIPLAVRA